MALALAPMGSLRVSVLNGTRGLNSVLHTPFVTTGQCSPASYLRRTRSMRSSQLRQKWKKNVGPDFVDCGVVGNKSVLDQGETRVKHATYLRQPPPTPLFHTEDGTFPRGKTAATVRRFHASFRAQVWCLAPDRTSSSRVSITQPRSVGVPLCDREVDRS